MTCECVWTSSETKSIQCYVMCHECKLKKKLTRLLTDFAIQWGQALKYKRFEEFTLAELDEWVSDYIDYRVLGKKDEDDE